MQYFIKVKFRRLLAVIGHCRAWTDYKIRKHYSTCFGRYSVGSEDARGPWTTDFPGGPAPPFSFLYLPFLPFLSVSRGPFSSGAPGHCPPMPPTRYATGATAYYRRTIVSRYILLSMPGLSLPYSINASRAAPEWCIVRVILVSVDEVNLL